MQAGALIDQIEREGGARDEVAVGGAWGGFASNLGRMGLAGARMGCAMRTTVKVGSATAKWGMTVVARSEESEWHVASRQQERQSPEALRVAHSGRVQRAESV